MHGLGHLDRQFARGHEHEALHGALAGFELVENGQGEGSGLAGAGLGLADHIVAGQHGRDQGGLDRGGRGEAKRFYSLHQLRVQVQLGKTGSHLFLLIAVSMTPLCRTALAGLPS